MLWPSMAKTPSVFRKADSTDCCASRQCDPVNLRAMRSGGEAAEARGELCNMFPQVTADRAKTITVALENA
jgi:hypothetical protein